MDAACDGALPWPPARSKMSASSNPCPSPLGGREGASDHASDGPPCIRTAGPPTSTGGADDLPTRSPAGSTRSTDRTALGRIGCSGWAVRPAPPIESAVPIRTATTHCIVRLPGRFTGGRPDRHEHASSTMQAAVHAQATHAMTSATCPSHPATARASVALAPDASRSGSSGSTWLNGRPAMTRRHRGTPMQVDARRATTTTRSGPGRSATRRPPVIPVMRTPSSRRAGPPPRRPPTPRCFRSPRCPARS